MIKPLESFAFEGFLLVAFCIGNNYPKAEGKGK